MAQTLEAATVSCGLSGKWSGALQTVFGTQAVSQFEQIVGKPPVYNPPIGTSDGSVDGVYYATATGIGGGAAGSLNLRTFTHPDGSSDVVVELAALELYNAGPGPATLEVSAANGMTSLIAAIGDKINMPVGFHMVVTAPAGFAVGAATYLLDVNATTASNAVVHALAHTRSA